MAKWLILDYLDNSDQGVTVTNYSTDINDLSVICLFYMICDCNTHSQPCTLQWRHNDHDGISNHQPRRLFTQPSIQTQIKENIKAPCHWPLCGEFTGTGEFPTQRVSYAENVSIWWRHHEESLFSWKGNKTPTFIERRTKLDRGVISQFYQSFIQFVLDDELIF